MNYFGFDNKEDCGELLIKMAKTAIRTINGNWNKQQVEDAIQEAITIVWQYTILPNVNETKMFSKDIIYKQMLKAMKDFLYDSPKEPKLILFDDEILDQFPAVATITEQEMMEIEEAREDLIQKVYDKADAVTKEVIEMILCDISRTTIKEKVGQRAYYAALESLKKLGQQGDYDLEDLL